MDERTLESAEALTAATVQDSIARIRSQVRPRDPSFDGDCEECGERIPDARLDTGARTCIDCQEFIERYRRRPSER